MFSQVFVIEDIHSPLDLVVALTEMEQAALLSLSLFDSLKGLIESFVRV